MRKFERKAESLAGEINIVKEALGTAESQSALKWKEEHRTDTNSNEEFRQIHGNDLNFSQYEYDTLTYTRALKAQGGNDPLYVVKLDKKGQPFLQSVNIWEILIYIQRIRCTGADLSIQ